MVKWIREVNRYCWSAGRCVIISIWYLRLYWYIFDMGVGVGVGVGGVFYTCFMIAMLWFCFCIVQLFICFAWPQSLLNYFLGFLHNGRSLHETPAARWFISISCGITFYLDSLFYFFHVLISGFMYQMHI